MRCGRQVRLSRSEPLPLHPARRSAAPPREKRSVLPVLAMVVGRTSALLVSIIPTLLSHGSGQSAGRGARAEPRASDPLPGGPGGELTGGPSARVYGGEQSRRPSPSFRVITTRSPTQTSLFPNEDAQRFPLIHLNPRVRFNKRFSLALPLPPPWVEIFTDKFYEVLVPPATGSAHNPRSPGSGAGSRRGEVLSRCGVRAPRGAPGHVVRGVLESAPSPTPLICTQKRNHLHFVFFLLVSGEVPLPFALRSPPTPQPLWKGLQGLPRVPGRGALGFTKPAARCCLDQVLPISNAWAEQARSGNSVCRKACFCVFILAQRFVY